MSVKIGVIGDVHGNLAALTGLLKYIDGTYDHLVFVGDYVNRGRDSAAVIQLLVDRSQHRADSSFVAGNHDIAFLDCLNKGELSEFLMIGGAATIRSYVSKPEADVLGQLRRSVPKEHIHFLRNLQPYYLHNGLLVTHAGNNLGKPFQDFSFHVYGHIPQGSLRPEITKEQAAIDTGCGTIPGGRLTCVFWPTMNFVQVDSLGHVIHHELS
ncbi:metallophosphoesterase [Amycolatopsis thailandensis]|uniref:metallophosphoesterase n=1 Tax=Amycolatopsis thailandensis TaxID=589330 RepID=UPI0037A58B22